MTWGSPSPEAVASRPTRACCRKVRSSGEISSMVPVQERSAVRAFGCTDVPRTAEPPNTRTVERSWFLGTTPYCGPDLLGKAMQLFHDGIHAGAGEIEDQVAHAQALICPDVLDDLVARPDERRPGSRDGTVRELDRGAEGQRDLPGIPTCRLGLGSQVGCGLRILVRGESGGRAQADGMPAVAQAGRAADGRLRVAADPDGRVRPLHRLGIEPDLIERDRTDLYSLATPWSRAPGGCGCTRRSRRHAPRTS